MPLLDHFHAPLDERYPWESLHSGWATRLADALNECLPEGFIAAEITHAGRLEVDVATFEQSGITRAAAEEQGGTAVATAPAYAPPTPAHTFAAVFPDVFEIRVFVRSGGLTLVGAIELVSPGNKDRTDEQTAFASKCAAYLHQGVSLIIVDIVTNRRANLHNAVMRLMAAPTEVELSSAVNLYAAAYRPVLRDGRPEIDAWPIACALGKPLPILPLRLTGDLFVPVDLEASYVEACRRRRLL